MARSRRRGRPSTSAEDILKGVPPAARDIAERLRRIVRECVPEAEERGYPGWRGIGYSHPEAGYFCGIFPAGDAVKLGFERGVELPDTDGVLSGEGSRVRYVVVEPGGAVPEKAIRRLLLLAATR